MPMGDRKKGPKRTRKRGEGSIYKKNGAYVIKYYEDGKARYKSSKKWSLKDAQEELRERLGKMDKGLSSGADFEKTTIGDLAELVINDYKVEQLKSLETVQCRINNLLAYFGKNAKAQDIKKVEIDRYVLARRENKKGIFRDQYGNEKVASDATILRELRTITKMFRLGVEVEKVAKVPPIPKLQNSKARQGWISMEEYLQLLKHLPDNLKPIVTFAWQTGWRKEEILSLQWKNIDRKKNTITIMDTKNNEPRTIPMDTEVRAVIERQHNLKWRGSGRKTHYVFHRHGKKIVDIRKAWAKATKAIGKPGLIFHDLRRSAARHMYRVVGLRRRDIMRIGGWKTESVFDRYNIQTDEDLEAAIEKISAANGH